MEKIIINAVLPTKSKMFCSCLLEEENQSCPVCLGLSGAYPVLNKKAVEEVIATVLALHGTINQYTLFDRVADENGVFSLISQYSYPIGKEGYVNIGTEDESEQVPISLFRMKECEEEKGLPMLEIISESVEEEKAPIYIEETEKVLSALGIEAWEIVEIIDLEEGASDMQVTYLPDPDIPPVIIGQWWEDQIAEKYPDLIHIERPEVEDDF